VNYSYAVDANVWIEYFRGRDLGKITKMLESDLVYTSIIAITEIADKFEREGKKSEDEILFVRSRGVILPVSIKAAAAAAKIKKELRGRNPKFGMADAIQLASARERNTKFLTLDHDFEGETDVVVLKI
jgi:predicted nucleic acid-binding protein